MYIDRIKREKRYWEIAFNSKDSGYDRNFATNWHKTKSSILTTNFTI